MHRQPPPESDASEARTPRFRFVDEPKDHPLGRLIAVRGDQMASSYRLKDRQIMVVNRRMGQRNLTITMLENDTNTEGRFLPHSYVVQYWDAASGKLLSAETTQERWQRVGSLDLPVLHSVTTASTSGSDAGRPILHSQTPSSLVPHLGRGGQDSGGEGPSAPERRLGRSLSLPSVFRAPPAWTGTTDEADYAR